MKPIRYLYLTHRWFGIVMCAFFAMWFFSGIVMMYVGFPNLTPSERFKGLAILDAATINYSPQPLLETLSKKSAIDKLILTSVLNRPAYLLKVDSQVWRGMYADTGEWFSRFSEQQIVTAAQNFFAASQHIKDVNATYDGLLELDQWTVSSGLHHFRPLHLVKLDDEEKTHLYISSVTGQVVRDTTGKERFWNWLGANLHWIYPVQLRKHQSLWSDVVIILSLVAMVSVITGSVIGILRLRFKNPYRGRSYTPYRGVMKYHHVLGLVFLLFLSTYLFSGLMSMNPWNIFTAKTALSQQLNRYRLNSEAVKLDAIPSSTSLLKETLTQYTGIKEITWHWVNGHAYIVLHAAPNQRFISLPLYLKPKNTLEELVRPALPKLVPTSHLVSLQVLTQYDAYYYSHHQRKRPLPIWRAKFNDEESSWFHIDLVTGEVIERLTRKSRVQRWLYNGLHSLDFSFLINRRPLWDIVVITLCSLGLVFSGTALTIAYRRLRLKKPSVKYRPQLRAKPPLAN